MSTETTIERYANGSDEELQFYLEDVSLKNFRSDVIELISKYSDNGLIDSIISELQKYKS